MTQPFGLWSALVTLIVTIGPIETAAVFASLTSGVHKSKRTSLAVRSVSIAGSVLLLFTVAGNVVLSALRVSLPAFEVAGGILLFLQALTLTFSSPGVSSLSEGEHRAAEGPGDIAVFPLAFPIIASPGSLSAVILLTARTHTMTATATIALMLAVCLLLTFVAMELSTHITRWLGETGCDVVSRISGVLLTALAVQFVFDGLQHAHVIEIM